MTPLPKVFLSASIQPPNSYLVGDQAYNTDRIAIRESVLILLAEVLKSRTVCFGGHPAISPFVLDAARSLHCLDDRVEIYQAGYFYDDLPADHYKFPNFKWDDGKQWRHPEIEKLSPKKCEEELQASLGRMRDKMLNPTQPYVAAFFMGGKKGIVDEWDLFAKNHPHALLFPLGSTGGAARHLWEQQWDHCRETWGQLIPEKKFREIYERLGASRRYRGLILDLLEIVDRVSFEGGAADNHRMKL